MTFGAPDRERAALETTYEDLLTLKRPTPTSQGGITYMDDTIIAEEVLCALAQGGDKSAQTEAQHSLDYDVTVFCGPELDVRPGDILAIKRFGEDYVFEVVGRPFRYATHQEIHGKARDLA